MIYDIEFSEINSTVLMYQLDTEDVLQMPFDGSSPAKDALSAQERMVWTLNRCVTNLEEVKDKIKEVSENKDKSTAIILAIYQCCVALNPVVDMVLWNFMVRGSGLYHDLFEVHPLEPGMPSVTIPDSLTDLDLFMDEDMAPPVLRMPPWMPTNLPGFHQPEMSQRLRSGEDEEKHLDKKKILTLEKYLTDNLIGQKEAIGEITKTLKRSIAGLKDDKRPLGVFLLTGSSGSGKTHTAKLIQEYLFGKNTSLVRVDCGEFQQKHEVMKLTGSPNSYVGFEDGGQLTNAIRDANNTVLLLDEAEKAHPDFWNLFLKVFDEGYLTDNKGEQISFENTIIIMTSNLGNDKIAAGTYQKSTGFNAEIRDSYESNKIPAREFAVSETKAAINRFFKPEFVNRLDDIIIFNYLQAEDLEKIAKLELAKIAKKLSKQDYHLVWSKAAEKTLADKSLKAVQGARAMSKIRRTEIEDILAEKILTDQPPVGTTFQLGIAKDKVTNLITFVVSIKARVPKPKTIEVS